MNHLKPSARKSTFTSMILFCSVSLATLNGAQKLHNIQNNPTPAFSAQIQPSTEEHKEQYEEESPQTSGYLQRNVRHFLTHKERILFKGKTTVNGQKCYCILTDDDVLFLFAHGANLEKQDPTSIDLAQYSYIIRKEGESNSFLLSSGSPEITSDPSSYTFSFEKGFDAYLHLFRCATPHYYYHDQQTDTLQPLQRDYPIPPDHQLIQLICRTEKRPKQKNIYCLFPPTNKLFCKGLKEMLSKRFRTSISHIVRFKDNQNLNENILIPWEKSSSVYWAVLAPYSNSAPFPKKELREVPQRDFNISCTITNGENLSNCSGPRPYEYVEHFKDLHNLDMRKENPLDQLEDPRALLKEMVLEFLENGCGNLIIDYYLEDDELSSEEESDDSNVEEESNGYIKEKILAQIRPVKYLTVDEFPFLEKAEKKMKCKRHEALGSPLNIAEICAILLYTEDRYDKVMKAHHNNDFAKWAVLDRCLMNAILKLHRVEKKEKRVLYAGVAGVHFSIEKSKGFFPTYVSTSRNRDMAIEFTNYIYRETARLKDIPGVLLCFSPEMQLHFPNCDVSWISSRPSEEEVLFARSCDMGILPPYKWQLSVFKVKIAPKKKYKRPRELGIQGARFQPFFEPLIVRRGVTVTLPAATSHLFSHIKLEEDATLTMVGDRPQNLICLGDFIVEEGAQIDVSEKSHPNGSEGSIHLKIGGDLHFAPNTGLFAPGIICLTIQGKVHCADTLSLKAKDRSKNPTFHLETQEGPIMLSLKKANKDDFLKFLTQPAACVLLEEEQHLRAAYIDVCTYWGRTLAQERDTQFIKSLVLLYLLNHNPEAVRFDPTIT